MSDNELTIVRLFDAPRERVFKAWTDPVLMRQWAAPFGFTITHEEGELREGGHWRCCMRSPQGADLWLSGEYREITVPSRLVFTHAWEDEQGKPGHETVITVTLEEEHGKTRQTFHQAFFMSVESRDGHRGGWNEGFDKLSGVLNKVDQE